MKHSLQDLWDKIEIHLNSAKNLLPQKTVDNPEGGSIKNFNEYLSHNELELALDELEGLGDVNNVSERYWKELFEAANLMNLDSHRNRYFLKLK